MWSRITAARVYGRERDRERASAFSTELTPRPSRGIIETSGRKKEATHTHWVGCVCVRGGGGNVQRVLAPEVFRLSELNSRLPLFFVSS